MEQNNCPLGWTTLEEARQLVEAGLPVETADMCYPHFIRGGADSYDANPVPCSSLDYPYEMPCWSLGALLKMIPKIYESEDDGGCYLALCKRYDTDKWHCLYHRDTLCKTRQYNTAIEAVVEMIIWLLNKR